MQGDSYVILIIAVPPEIANGNSAVFFAIRKYSGRYIENYFTGDNV